MARSEQQEYDRETVGARERDSTSERGVIVRVTVIVGARERDSSSERGVTVVQSDSDSESDSDSGCKRERQ